MTEQERLAREWAERNKACDVSSPEIQAAADFILANTAPPTMADVEWDSEKYYLAGAVDANGDEVVMLSKWFGSIRVFQVGQMDLAYPVLESPKTLTPNGKRYELRDITVSQDEKVGDDQAEHPKVLRTVEDYEDAPMGTIVATPAGIGSPFLKLPDGQWYLGDKSVGCAEMAIAEPREVLRWGRGE